MRSYLVPDKVEEAPQDLAKITRELVPRHTTAAYLILSNGEQTVTMEKDYSTAVVRESSSFIVATNHDTDGTSTAGGQLPQMNEGTNMKALLEILEESKDRMQRISKKWASEVRRAQRRSRRTQDYPSISEAQVIEWVSAWPLWFC